MRNFAKKITECDIYILLSVIAILLQYYVSSINVTWFINCCLLFRFDHYLSIQLLTSFFTGFTDKFIKWPIRISWKVENFLKYEVINLFYSYELSYRYFKLKNVPFQMVVVLMFVRIPWSKVMLSRAHAKGHPVLSIMTEI